jgi:GTP-binding protein
MSRRRSAIVTDELRGALPIVAIVGRPNVGKSTLFNRLAGKRIAIVEDVPGVTRDRQYAVAESHGRYYILVDTGGFDPESPDPLMGSIASQVELAVEEADFVICVVDAQTDPMPADRIAVTRLRKSGKAMVFVANKADSPRLTREAMGHYELGIDEVVPISALHGLGMPDLEARIAASLPEQEEEVPEEEQRLPRIAIVGRPNAGKSSLVNRLLGEERLVVDDRPGTTVDSVDSVIERDGKRLVIIDTAGIRKKNKVQKVRGVEGLAVIHAIRAMERSHAVVLLVDANEGPGEQDAKIATLAEERGRALVIGLNKMDLVRGEEARKKILASTRETFRGQPWAPILPISVAEGRGLKKILDATLQAVAAHDTRVPTSELNRFFEEVLEHHPPPAAGTRSVRLYYITQAEVRPPTFVIMANLPDAVHPSYKRYVEKQLRVRFGFEGTTLRIRFRARRRRDDPAYGN